MLRLKNAGRTHARDRLHPNFARKSIFSQENYLFRPKISFLTVKRLLERKLSFFGRKYHFSVTIRLLWSISSFLFEIRQFILEILFSSQNWHLSRRKFDFFGRKFIFYAEKCRFCHENNTFSFRWKILILIIFQLACLQSTWSQLLATSKRNHLDWTWLRESTDSKLSNNSSENDIWLILLRNTMRVSISWIQTKFRDFWKFSKFWKKFWSYCWTSKMAPYESYDMTN